MRFGYLLAVAIIAAACCAAPEHKRISQLPSAGQPQARYTESVIGADLAYFDKLKQRLARLASTPGGVQAYYHAKASAWIDLALNEYQNNDRSPVIENALAQAERLLAALEAKAKTPSAATPLLPGSERIRVDLWQKAARAKRHAGFACAAPTVARLEVQLAWAGYELAQSGWRNASSYIQSAEDLSQSLDQQLTGCSTPARG